MGSIWLDRDQLTEFLGEFIGTKLGLVVDEHDIDRFLASGGVEVPATKRTMRLRSEVFEDLALKCLKYFGDPDASHVGSSPSISRSVLGAFGDSPETMNVMSYVIKELGSRVSISDGRSAGVEDILSAVEERWGHTGQEIALRIFQELNAASSPVRGLRPLERSTTHASSSVLSLRLPTFLKQFSSSSTSGSLTTCTPMSATPRGSTGVSSRALVSEALVRAGLRVEIGPGRNDDGVDIRAWDPNKPDDVPALLLVQCKPEKEKVGKVVVKALAADVLFEGAKVGLVATTSSWSPGARETVRARKYSLVEANGGHVREWIRQMRTPGTGPWLVD